MARGATILQFDIEVSDVDRGVYEAVSLSAAQHPSESAPYLVARVLAYALELEEGIGFTAGLSDSEQPAAWVRDRTDHLVAWIEVGTPDGPRLHKASKAADRVAVYCHRDPRHWLRGLARERVHGAEEIALFGFPPRVIEELAEGLARRNRWSLSRIDGTVYLEVGATTHELAVERISWPQP